MTSRRELLQGLAVTATGLLLPARIVGAPQSLFTVESNDVQRIQHMGGTVEINRDYMMFQDCVFQGNLTLHLGAHSIITNCIVNGNGAASALTLMSV